MNASKMPTQEFEKKTILVSFLCTPSEKKCWDALFPYREFSRKVRELLNREAAITKQQPES